MQSWHDLHGVFKTLNTVLQSHYNLPFFQMREFCVDAFFEPIKENSHKLLQIVFIALKQKQLKPWSQEANNFFANIVTRTQNARAPFD